MEKQDNFNIQFQRTGGFAGIVTNAEIDSKRLDTEEIEKIKLLISQSNFFGFQQTDSLSKNIPDQFQYVITIKQGDKKKTIELTDSTVPDSFIPLINYLTQKSRKGN